MKKLILLCVLIFISSTLFSQSSTQWHQTEYYSQGADHFVLGKSEWVKSKQESKRQAYKDALLNFSSFTNLSIDSSYIEEMTTLNHESKFSTEEKGFITNNSKVGRVHYVRGKTEKNVREGFFNDEVTFRSIVLLRINDGDVKTYDDATTAADATELILSQATKSNRLKGKEAEIDRLLNSLKNKEKEMDKLLKRLQNQGKRSSFVEDEVLSQLQEDSFRPLQIETKEVTERVAFAKPTITDAAWNKNGMVTSCLVKNNRAGCTSSHKSILVNFGGKKVMAKSVVVPGMGYACFINLSNKVECYGENGMIGRPKFKNVVQIVSGGKTNAPSSNYGKPYVCALLAPKGTVRCWNVYSNMAIGTPSLTDIVKLTSGWSQVCGLDKRGKVHCFGSNYGRQSYGGSQITRYYNSGDMEYGQLAADGEIAVDVESAWHNVCIVRRDGNVKCWGNKYVAKVPTRITNVKQISPGSWSACALMNDGSVDCWGLRSDKGPQIPVDAEVTRLFARRSMHCAILKGTSKPSCWNFTREDATPAKWVMKKF